LSPLEFLTDQESSFLGVNALELNLQLRSATQLPMFNTDSKLFNSEIEGIKTEIMNAQYGHITSDITWDGAPPEQFNTAFGGGATSITAKMTYISIHPSQFSKISSKNALPLVDYNTYNTISSDRFGDYVGPQTTTCNFVSLNQIPDKIFLTAQVNKIDQKPWFSNHLCCPISKVNITFNNKSGLLSDLTKYELWQMSKRNGSTQSWNEFRGIVKDGEDTKLGIGSIVVIDPVLDLGLTDYLTSGSLGQYGLQVEVSYDAKSVSDKIPWLATKYPEIMLTLPTSGIMVTNQGMTQVMTGLITKSMVLSAKSKKADITYDRFDELVGGSCTHKAASSAIGQQLKRYAQPVKAALRGKFEKKSEGAGFEASGGGYGAASGGGGDKMTKYIS